MNIFVGNLNFRSSEQQIEDLFSSFGAVESVKIIKDQESGRSRGFAFVEMGDEEGHKAIDALNGTSLDDRELAINEARPKRSSNNNNFRRNRY